MIVSTAVCEVLAHDRVPSLLKPYAENQHPYHPFKGTGCTGLSDDNDSLFRWFKFTLKPPNSITDGNFFSAIWDTSHWNFFVKFGLKTPYDIS